jgi:hypothetical protein
MQRNIVVSLAVSLFYVQACCGLRAEMKAETVSTRLVWDLAPRNESPDLVRFQDRWLIVLVESTGPYSQDGALRILASKDQAAWESVALIKSPTPKKGLYDPKFTIMSDGRLMLSAFGVIPTPGSPDPVPLYGGTLKTMVWHSKDGLAWGKPERAGDDDFPLGRIAWQKGVAYGYARGRICGIAQTVRIYANPVGKDYKPLFEETFSGFFPEDAAVFFEGDSAYCLMSRTNAEGANAAQKGLLGVARPPHRNWEWKPVDQAISFPNLVRVSMNQIVAVVGLHDKKRRTSLCEFDLATGKFNELLEIPTGGGAVDAGLVFHDEHLWVSYRSSAEGKPGIYLAKVKLR